MIKQLRLKAMNSKEVILPQFKEINLDTVQFDGFKNIIFVKIPIDFGIEQYRRVLKLISKLEKETGRSFVAIPDVVGFFQVEHIPIEGDK